MNLAKHSFLLKIILPLFIFLASSANAGTYYNEFEIQHSSDIKIKVEYDSSVVTDGQQCGDCTWVFGWLKSGAEYDKYIFVANRKGSSDIANDFVQEINDNKADAAYQMQSTYTERGSTPKTLNFYIRTKLIINDSPVVGDFYFAQEGINSRNQWWVGTTQTKGDKGKYLTRGFVVTTEDGNLYYIGRLFDSNPTNVFRISKY